MPKIDIDKLEIRIGSNYPTPFDGPCRLREGIDLGTLAGLTQFGAKIITLPPGAWSSQRHWHSHEDELVYILTGNPTFIDDAGEQNLSPGDVTAHPGGDGNGHHMINKTDENVSFLVIGTRAPEKDSGHYPDIDLAIPSNGTAARVYVRKEIHKP